MLADLLDNTQEIDLNELNTVLNGLLRSKAPGWQERRSPYGKMSGCLHQFERHCLSSLAWDQSQASADILLQYVNWYQPDAEDGSEAARQSSIASKALAALQQRRDAYAAQALKEILRSRRASGGTRCQNPRLSS